VKLAVQLAAQQQIFTDRQWRY